MKRLWVLAIFAIIIVIQPVQSIQLSTEETSVVNAEISQSFVPRIYGEDISYSVFQDITFNGYKDIVRKFTENGSRYIMDFTMADRGTNLASRNYLIQQFDELSNGRIEIEIIGDHRNIVGRLPGYLPGEHPVFIISAHYDTVDNSPGANCDGSGIAAVLSLVRMLSGYDWPLDIYFIAFNGLHTLDTMSGSPEVANEFLTRGIEIMTMYNVDTLLVDDPGIPLNERIRMGYSSSGLENYHLGQYWAELATMMSNNYGANRIVPVPSGQFEIWGSSDHYPFYMRGFTNILCAYESGGAHDGSLYTINDSWDNNEYNYALGTQTTSAVGASIAFTMSRRYGAPTQRIHNFTQGSGRTKLLSFLVSTPTIVNVTARWYGGFSNFSFTDSEFNVLSSQIYYYSHPWNSTEIFSQSVTTKGTYYIIVENIDSESVGYDISITYNTDVDANDVLDSEEYWLDMSYFTSDQDGDTISDADEIFLGTDMNNIDSDSDTMPDNYELEMGFDPTDPSDANLDADSDGLTNAQEYSGGLNPLSSDSDGDLMDDLWELTNGLNPLVDDADLDPDGDEMSNLEEYIAGTDPHINDLEPQSMIWLVSPIVIIAPIAGLLYLRRRNDQMIS
jgi:hypothetical protein